MYTLILPGRSHIVTNDVAKSIFDAIELGQPFLKVGIELNGEGSGNWNVTINANQIVALIEHPESVLDRPRAELRLVNETAS